MSAAFKIAKKKYTQQDLRRIMSETKAAKQQTETPGKRIDSPLARYNETGQLTCALCRSVVRSETVWKVHINSKQHKENIEQAKKLKEQAVTAKVSTQQPQKQTAPESLPAAAFKRPVSPAKNTPSSGSKKLKGILKNSDQPQKLADGDSLPADFFDSRTTINKNLVNIRLPVANAHKADAEEQEAAPSEPPTDEEKLPEGFFDDPKADAKARNIEYKDPNDEEWERFQKEIKEATTESLAIISEEQEESTVERQIGEIDEQIRNWSRVLSLEKKKEQVRSKTVSALEAGQKMVQVKKEKQADSDDEGDDADFDEFPDWRAKKSFK
ncbi:zinc finger protein 830 [Wyeomyia smithii]|uniref:zinc finger protein 830 n=1 Tax=Wyeomyia smithii TaxID=174621 RepID=UPI002467D75F|nr:zinc finger protein 830 [Wyeomyia smithii]